MSSEQTKLPSEFSLPSFTGDELPVPNFASAATTMPIFPGNIMAKQTPANAYDPSKHQPTGTLNTTPISEKATGKISNLSLNAPAPAKTIFPYFIISAAYGDDQVFLVWLTCLVV